MYGKMWSLGSLKSFLWCTCQQSGASILSFHRVPQDSPMGVATVWWLLDGRYSLFPSRVSSGFTSSPSVVSVITNDGDFLCLLIWQGIFYFSIWRALIWHVQKVFLYYGEMDIVLILPLWILYTDTISEACGRPVLPGQDILEKTKLKPRGEVVG